MNILRIIQFLDVWTPTPVESSIFLIVGLFICAIPIIIAVLVIILLKKHKKKKKNNSIENQDVQKESINDKHN